jgi:transcriptional regulator with XRE-family HTH domain
MNIREILALNLRKLRRAKRLLQEQLAHDAGIDRTYISSLERCVYTASIDVVDSLARVLGVEAADLLKATVTDWRSEEKIASFQGCLETEHAESEALFCASRAIGPASYAFTIGSSPTKVPDVSSGCRDRHAPRGGRSAGVFHQALCPPLEFDPRVLVRLVRATAPLG